MGLSEEDMKLHKRALMEMGLYEPLLAICSKHHVRFDVVLSDDRTASVVKARASCCLHLRELGMSYSEIGKAMIRDHTAVISLVKKAKREGQNDEPPSTT